MKVKLLANMTGIALDSETSEELELLRKFFKRGVAIHSFGELLDGTGRLILQECTETGDNSDDLAVKAFVLIHETLAQIVNNTAHEYLGDYTDRLESLVSEMARLDKMRRTG